MNNYGSSSKNRTIHPSLSPTSSDFIVRPPPCISTMFLTSTSSGRQFPRLLTKFAETYRFANLLLLLLRNANFRRQSTSRHHLPQPHAVLIPAGVFTLWHTWRCYIWTPAPALEAELCMATPHPCNRDLPLPNKQMGYEGSKSADSVLRSIHYWLMQTSAMTRAPENFVVSS